MKINIDGNLSSDPRDGILALEAVTYSLCDKNGQDAAEGVMMLLTAAAHLTMKHADKSAAEVTPSLVTCLGHAIDAADGFFTLQGVGESDDTA